jgi:SAM-dependent methyltransferase
MATWKEIWEARHLDSSRPSLLAQLMAADGFDSGFGNLDEAGWRHYVNGVAGRLGIAPPMSVFEVGCGSGAFVYSWYEAGCAIGGLDASQALLAIARKVMPNAQLECDEAIAIDPAVPYDVVVSSGVFLYFPSLEYAAEVLARMYQKARRGLAVLDVPDAARKSEALAMRRGYLDEAAYEAKYRGLDHLYFERSWFSRELARLGAASVAVVDQDIPGYANGAHRFNVFATK